MTDIMYMIHVTQLNAIFRADALTASVFTLVARGGQKTSVAQSLIRKLIFLVLIAAMLCSLMYVRTLQADASPSADTSTPAGNVQRLLIIGDSLSAGYGMDVELSWPTLLQQRFAQRNMPVQVINASISGQTSAEGVAQIEQLLDHSQADLVILELGVNDGLRGLPIAQMKHNLSAMIEASKARDARVLLLGMHVPLNYGRRYGQMFHQAFEQLAVQYDIARVPFMLETVALQAKYVQDDGLHPTKEAQPLILEHLWPAIEAELSEI